MGSKYSFGRVSAKSYDLIRAPFVCQLSNFKNDLTPGRLEPGPNGIAHTSAGMAEAADFFLRTPTLTASNFAALWSTDPKFLAFIDLNPFSKCVKFQDAGGILRVAFAWSNWPHLHRGY